MHDQLDQQDCLWDFSRRQEFVQGDPDVWREFIEREIPRLHGLFLRRWPNRSLAEELVQRTVFDAVRGRGGYEPSRGSPEEWIRGIARNNIRLEIRKRAGRPIPNGDISRYFEAIDTEPLPDEVLEREETAGMVRAALEKLEGRERAVLEAKYVEELSAGEIARQMDTTEKAVHSLLYRARGSLRRELERQASPNRKG
ncbi:MAG: sigma-70 family RNA polymerase sigma factor [Phycisphaerales bacterium]|nr:MAG: sigma-70 family RNA polymerase sigma factor [Phycisphaerales bacterium]